MFELNEKRALVTGASGAIGGAIARNLHRQGATVGLSGTRREALEAVAAELGERAFVLPCDLSDAEQVEQLMPQAVEALGGDIDILVNNAGMTRDMLFARLTDEDWLKVMEVNLTSAFRLSRAAVRAMMRQRWGRIISVTSVVGVTGNPGQSNYAASKAGMIGMTKSLAGEIASRKVTVNCIAPVMVETGLLKEMSAEYIAERKAKIPMERFCSGEDIADMAAFIASPRCAFTTGQVFDVTGGRATY